MIWYIFHAEAQLGAAQETIIFVRTLNAYNSTRSALVVTAFVVRFSEFTESEHWSCGKRKYRPGL